LPAARPWLATRAGLEAYQGRGIKPEDNGFAEGERLVPPCRRTIWPYTPGSGHLEMYARAIAVKEFEFYEPLKLLQRIALCVFSY
jgi:phosphomethylpyrimidine synthase